MRSRSVARLLLPLAAGLALATPAVAAAAVAPAPAGPRISGSDLTVWSLASPIPAYTLVSSVRGGPLTWTLSGTALKGAGPSPLRIRLPGLTTGTYFLDVTQPPGGARARARRIVHVDLLPPTITIRQPVEGAVYGAGQAVAVDFACGRAAVSCIGTLPTGAALPTAAPGTGTFSVSATDAAGNRGTRTVNYAIGPPAPVIVARPPQPLLGNRPAFAWTGGAPGAFFTWQVISGGTVVSQGDTFDDTVTLGPLLPGAYAFQVSQVDPDGHTGPFSVADPFTVVTAVPAVIRRTPPVRSSSRLHPAAGAAVTAARPLLSWKAVPRARLYNLQVFRVRDSSVTKISSTFPHGTRTRVRGLRFGSRYAWRVWPYRRGSGYTAEPLGLSYFDLVRPVRPDSAQMLVSRRIAEAAVRRAAAIEAWLDAGLTAGDFRHQGLGTAAFDPALGATGAADAGGTAAAAVRPIPTGGPATRGRRRIPATGAELLRTQRIAQSAVRRIDALERRLRAGLTGGDIVDGSIGPEKLGPGVVLGAPGAAGATFAPTVTVVAPGRTGPARVRLDRRRLLIAQEISQGAVRRAEALRQRLLFGLSTADFRPGSIGTADLTPALSGRRAP